MENNYKKPQTELFEFKLQTTVFTSGDIQSDDNFVKWEDE